MRNPPTSQPDDRELAGLFSDLIDLAEDYVEVTLFGEVAAHAEDDDVEPHKGGAFGDCFLANSSKLLRFLVLRAPDRNTAEGLALGTWEAFLQAEGWLHRKPIRLLYAMANRLLLEEARRSPNQIDTPGLARELSIEQRDKRPIAENGRRIRTNVDGMRGLARTVEKYFGGLAGTYSGESRRAPRSARKEETALRIEAERGSS